MMFALAAKAVAAAAIAFAVPSAALYCNFETCLLEFDHMDWNGDGELNVDEVQYTICADVRPIDFEAYDVDSSGGLDFMEWSFVCSDYYEYGR